MKTMLQEIEDKLQDLALEEARDPQDATIKAEIAEWKAMKRKMAVIEKMSKTITSRISELEAGFDEVIKTVDGHKAVIDGAIVEYVQKKGNTTVKYKEAVDYALKMVNEAQKKVLEEFIKSVTKAGAITDVLAVTDPELEQYLLDLKGVTGDELITKIETTSRTTLDRFPKQVASAKKRELKEGVADNIGKVIKSIVSSFKRLFSSFFKSADKAAKANEALVKAIKADPLSEGMDVQVIEEGVAFGKWTLIEDAKHPQLVRYSGKTWPTISYNKASDVVYARDDNGRKPSANLETTDITVEGVKDLIKNKISAPLPSVDAIKALLGIVSEAQNHMGEIEFTSFPAWKGACRKADSQVWFNGDMETSSAMVGAKPFKKGSTQIIGEFHAGHGTVFGDAHLN